MKITKLLISLISTAALLTACVGGSNPSNNDNNDTTSQVNNFWFDSTPGTPLITNLTTSNTGFYSTGAYGYYGVYTPSSSATDGYWNVSVHADHLVCSDNIIPGGNCIGSANGPAGPTGAYANGTIQGWTTGWFMYYGDWTFSFNNGNQCTTNFGLGMVNSQWFVQPPVYIATYGNQSYTFPTDTVITQDNNQPGLGLACNETLAYNIAIYNNGNNSNEMYVSLIPGGDYVLSCQNIVPSMSGNTLSLSAQCYNQGNEALIDNTVILNNMNTITYTCTNSNGNLSCGGQYNPSYLPGGSWYKSCRDGNISVQGENYTLTATCANDVQWVSSSVTLSSSNAPNFSNNTSCTNTYGTLSCQSI